MYFVFCWEEAQITARWVRDLREEERAGRLPELSRQGDVTAGSRAGQSCWVYPPWHSFSKRFIFFFSLPMLQELAWRHGYVVSSVVCWMYFLSCACVVFVITWLCASFLETFGTSWPWISITCCSRKLSLSKLVNIDFNSPSSPWIWRNVKKTHWLKPVLVMDTLFQFVSNFL